MDCSSIPFVHRDAFWWPGAVSKLEEQLHHPDVGVRVRAVQCMGNSSSAEVQPILLKALKDSHPEVIAEALRALERLGKDEACGDIAVLLMHKSPEVRENAARYAGKMLCYETSQALLRATRDKEASVRIAALHALQRIPSPNALSEISPLLDMDDETSIAAMELMATACPDSSDDICLNILSDKLRDTAPEVRLAACKVFQAIADSRAYSQLVTVLRSDSVMDVRLEALRAILSLHDPRFLTILLAQLDRQHIDDMQMLIVRSLTEGNADEMIPMLLELSAVPELQTSVQAALCSMSDRSVGPLTKKLEKTADAGQRLFLLDTLGRMSSPIWSEVFPALLTEDERYLQDIVRIFVKIDHPKANYYLTALIPSISDAVLSELVEAAAERGNDVFLSAVCERFDTATPRVQMTFLKYLQNIQNFEAIPKLIDISSSKRAIKFRVQAILALQRSAFDREVQSFLLKMLQSPEVDIRYAAAIALMESDTVAPELLSLASSGNVEALLSLGFSVRFLEDPSEYIAFAQGIIQNLSDERAYSALELLLTLHRSPEVGESSCLNARYTIQRKLIECLVVAGDRSKAEIILHGLRSGDIALRSDALWAAGELGLDLPEVRGEILRSVRSPESRIAVNAMVAAGRLDLREGADILSIRVNDANAMVAHSALWALQKMKMLPPVSSLKSLYFRTQASFFKQYLSDLTGLPPVQWQSSPVHKMHDSWYLIDLKTDNRRNIGETLGVWLPDNSIRMMTSDVHGKMRLENVAGGAVYPLY